ncbi:MarR family transcriptional regulator [Brucella tritici]|nr:MarR family transcriptional regulator [Brucella tritici]
MFKPLADETPSSRLRQLGMMNLLYSLYKAESPLTLTAVTELTGMNRTSAQETIDPLVERGLLVASMGRTSLGRGKAWQYEIAPHIFEKLRDLYGE